jgi:hypothetical protein
MLFYMHSYLQKFLFLQKVGVTPGDPMLPTEDPPTAVRREGDPLRTISMNMAPESLP